MSLFGRLFGPPAPVAEKDAHPGDSHILPSDKKIVCNRCDTDQPMFSITLLRDYAIRDGKVVSEVTGERVACQVCGHTFAISPRGKFVPSPDALPRTPQPGPPRLPGEQRQPEPPPEAPHAPMLPVPHRRPTV